MATPLKAPVESEKEIKRAVTLNPDQIQTEYAELPATLSRWIFRRVELTKAYRLAELDLDVAKERAKLNLETVEATVKTRIRAENKLAIEQAAVGEKVKPLTEDQVEMAMALDQEYQAARLHSIKVKEEREILLIEAEEARARAAGMVEAITAKKDMLVSLGADLRSEKEGDPSIRDRQRR